MLPLSLNHDIEYRAVGHRLESFPTEILDKIFRATLETWYGNKFGDSVDSPSLRLSQVCGRWRSIVRDSPSLWARLTWHIKPVHKPKNAGCLELLEMALQLSRHYPLILSVYVCRAGSTETAEAIHLLCQHSERWRSLEITLPHDATWHELREPFKSVEGRLPILQDLMLDFPHDEGMETFFRAPMLRTARTHGHVDLKWSQLQELTLMKPQSLPLILSQCSQLKTLFLFDIFVADDMLFPDERIHITIEQLTLVFNSSKGSVRLLSRLVAPNLNNLILRCPRPTSLLDAEDVIGLVDNSKCHLTTLNLINIAMSPTELVSLLRALPAIAELRIEEKWEPRPHFCTTLFTNELFDALNVRSAADIVLPALQHLSIVMKHAEPFPTASFLDAVYSRLPAVSERIWVSLSRLQLTAPPETFSLTELARVQKTAAFGVAVYVCIDL